MSNREVPPGGGDDRDDPYADVHFARRRVATFRGASGPTLADHMREFVRRYGWRAYALPVLLVVTVVAPLTTGGNRPSAAARTVTAGHRPSAVAPTHSSASSTAPLAPSSIPLKSDAVSTGSQGVAALKGSQLPAGGPYTKYGTGTFAVVPGTSPIAGKTGRLYRYDIEVEHGITGVNVAQFAALVQSTLANPKSWSGHGVRVQRVDSGTVDFHVGLTSAMTVRTLCGYTIHVETSCYAPASRLTDNVNRVVLNVARWVRGAASYVGDLNLYRIYMINHEDGHAMGHEHAHQCLSNGMAPTMMQQTFGLRSATTGKFCTANPWPYPPGVTDAPGKEAADTVQNNEYYIGD